MAGLLWYRSYMDSLANTSGYYPDIHAGHADRVTELTLEAPYLIREVPSGYNQLELSQIIGGTMVVEGSLQSVEALVHVAVGFNQWDEEWELGTFAGGSLTGSTTRIRNKHPIPVIPNTTYYYEAPQNCYVMQVNAESGWTRYVSEQVGRHTTFTVQSWARFIYFSPIDAYGATYNNDICINISKTTGTPKNGDYMPYVESTFPLANITLRGISTTVDGILSYYGDTYDPNGTVTRYFGERAYQAGDESLTDAVTDGTNTVYKLTTPTTETAAPYTATQTVEEGGTVQFITSNNVPVGNISIYRRV